MQRDGCLAVGQRNANELVYGWPAHCPQLTTSHATLATQSLPIAHVAGVTPALKEQQASSGTSMTSTSLKSQPEGSLQPSAAGRFTAAKWPGIQEERIRHDPLE